MTHHKETQEAQQLWLLLRHLLQADFHPIKVISIIFKDKEFQKNWVGLFAYLLVPKLSKELL